MILLGNDITIPFPLYSWQEATLKFLKESKSKIKLVESPTGSGKTLVALYYALTRCPDCKIIFFTRTNSQVENVFRESRILGINRVVSFMGRSEMCLFKKHKPEMSEGDPEEQSRFCQKLIQDRIEGKDGCFYDIEYKLGWFDNIVKPNELIGMGEKRGFCPYFAQRQLLKDAKVIVTTYSYILNPYVRDRFMDWVSTDYSKIILIFDEAHNIPDTLRGMNSSSLSLNDISKARDEVAHYGDKSIENISISLVLDSIKESLEYIFEDGDRLLTADDAREYFMKGFSAGTLEIKRVLESMVIAGEIIKETKLNEGKLPRSYTYKVATLSINLMEDSEPTFIRVVESEDKEINMKYLDVSESLSFLNEYNQVLFISGTLSPFEKFKDELGLKDAEEISLKVPYLDTNLKVLYTDEFSLNYPNREDSEPKLLSKIEEILNKTNYNTVVFATSYEELSKIRDLNIDRRVYFERKNITNSELNEMLIKFRAKGGVLLGVINGRLSEGLDLPGKLLELGIIAGIPYPRPTPETYAMETYYDMKFMKGWLYAYEAVASIRLRQTIGRLIRSPTDRGVAIILDSRARKFRKSLPNLYLSSDLINDTISFLSQ